MNLIGFFWFLYNMIIRIVRMHFREGGIKEFLEIFDKNKEKIRNFPGCTHLQLLKDADDPLCYTTYSHWNGPDDLENYRKSELFGSVWKPVKKLFSGKSEAFSLEKFVEL
ncbi:antibiotic biosynthesis monooxygenase [soil metagenome]